MEGNVINERLFWYGDNLGEAQLSIVTREYAKDLNISYNRFDEFDFSGISRALRNMISNMSGGLYHVQKNET